MSDDSHPSWHGTFLTALSFVKKITGTLPTRYKSMYNYPAMDKENIFIMWMPQDDVFFYDKIVKNYFK
jgi:hypothetical protein